jgi:hypothetical protein
MTLAIILGTAAFGIGVFVEQAGLVTGNVAMVLVLAGLASVVLATEFGWRRLRCPICDGRLFNLLIGSSPRLRINPQVRWCPYCGQDFDEEAPSHRPESN